MNGNLPTARTNLAVIVLLFIIVGSAIVLEGCKHKSQKLPVPATRLFHNFDKVESIQLTIGTTERDIKCTIPKELWSKFRSAFENAIPEPNPAKWAVHSTVNYRINGEDFEALLLYVKDNEGGLRVSIKEYWRNIDKDIIEEVVQECVKQ